MSNLTVSIIQTHLYWESISENLDHFDALINGIEETDLILLPETFSTAFSMNSDRLAEPMDGSAMQWMRNKSAEKQAIICGSLIIREDGNIFNRCICMKPDGTYEKYDKRHLFRMGNEDEHFTAGKEHLIVEVKGWKICPQICYDLRFPVWARNTFQTDGEAIGANYDLLIYMANWPEVRVEAWEKLLYARAIENQSYVAAVNRIGKDGLGVNCSGSSMLIDYTGKKLWKAADQTEEVETITINKDDLNRFRKKFPVGMDADQFEINP